MAQNLQTRKSGRGLFSYGIDVPSQRHMPPSPQLPTVGQELSPPLPPCSVLPIQFPVLIGVICAPGNLPWVTSSKKRRCKQKVRIPIILYVLKTKEIDKIELSNVHVSIQT